MPEIRVRRALVLLAIASLCATGCLQGADDSAGPEIRRKLVLRLVPQIQPALMTAEPISITRAHWEITEGGEREVLSRDSTSFDAEEPESLVVIVELSVEAGDHFPEGYLRLVGEDRVAQWSGTFRPVPVHTRQETWTIPVEMGRGDLANLSVTAVTISGSQGDLVVGQSRTLSATTNGGQGTLVFWGSRTPGVATVDAQGRVQAVSPGEATIVASAGMHADSVTVRVVASGT